MRLVILFDDAPAAIAKNALDTCRALQRRMRDEARGHSNHSPRYRALEDEWHEMAGELAQTLLDAALYWSDEGSTA